MLIRMTYLYLAIAVLCYALLTSILASFAYVAYRARASRIEIVTYVCMTIVVTFIEIGTIGAFFLPR